MHRLYGIDRVDNGRGRRIFTRTKKMSLKIGDVNEFLNKGLPIYF
jgi:hypothetical protein